MKKMNYLSVFALLAVIGFSSCKDEPIVVSSAVTVATKDSAVISGYVTAELNLQSAGMEAVPAGTSILVSLPYSELNSAATGNWLRTVTVGTDGKYSVKVPTNSNGVTVMILPSTFVYDQAQGYVAGTTTPNLKLTYSMQSSQVNVISGQSINKDLAYTASTSSLGVARVTISGKAQADLDASIIGLENLPDGTKIIFTANGWADSTTVTAGKYSISVPKGYLISWNINKIISTKIWNSNSDPAQSTYISVNKTYAISGQNSFFANNASWDIISTGVSIISSPSLTTTIYGTVKAQLDLTTIDLENLPDGSRIYFYTSTWGATATVTNGNFNIVVPVGTTINCYILQTTNQKSQSNVLYPHTFTLSTSFYSGTGTSMTLPLIVPDILITSTLTGTAKAELDLSTYGLENLPDGTKITFSTTTPSWSEAATVTNGTYAINVPVYTSVNYSIQLTASQKSSNGLMTTHTFQANSSFYSSSTTSTLNITATAIN